MDMTPNLNGRNAIVTGSTSGIGLGIARALAGAGANIMLNGLGDTKKIEALRAGLEKEFRVKAQYSDADMSKGEEITEMIHKTEANFGAIDILVNNAGIQFVSAIEQFPPSKWEAIIAINLSSSFYSINAALPGMKERGWGRIINIASIHGLVASPFKSAYVAAKHGVVGLTKVVALETAEQNITCNAICPGYVRTPLVENQIRDQAKAHNMTEDEVVDKVMMQWQPNRRFVETGEIGALALFLCSEASRSITGASLPIDGAWTAR